MVFFLSQPPLVVSYYTLNTPYEEEVKHLKVSCEKFGIEAHIEPVSCMGSWENNCALKPFFIYEKMKCFERPIFWVDADAVFLQKPSFDLFLSYDFSVARFGKHVEVSHRVRASAIFINSTIGGFHIVEDWCRQAKSMTRGKDKAPAFLDQTSLYAAILRNECATTMQMPLRYCKIFDIDACDIAQEEVVIEQNQASRRNRSFFAHEHTKMR